MYFGETVIQEGFFDRFKKKKNNQENKNNQDIIKHRAPTKDEINKIKTLIKGYVTYYNSSKAKQDPDVIKAINDFQKFYNEIKEEEGKEYANEILNNGKIPKMIFKIFEETSGNLDIIICDDGQDCCSFYACDIIDSMIEKLKQDIPNYSEFISRLSSGDGDEGVLYIDFYK